MQNAHDPKISVIVPARNEAAEIVSCLRALSSQDIAEHYEIIVVDNGSTDDTSGIASAFPVTIVHEPRPGCAMARNAGIRAASGEILAFTDADCVPDRSWLRELVTGMEDASCGCVIGEIMPREQTSLITRYVHDRVLFSQIRQLTLTPTTASTASIAYRREVLDTIGVFDTTFAFAEDRDLFWRMVRSERFRYRYNPRAVVFHHYPVRLGEFIRHSLRKGAGAARFKRKHHADVPASQSSSTHAAFFLIKSLVGTVLIPIRALRLLSSNPGSPRNALAYPLLDKLGAIARKTGSLLEHAFGPTFPTQDTDPLRATNPERPEARRP